MPSVYSPSEKQLVIELAVGIARRLNIILGASNIDHPPPGYFSHMHISSFENGCSVLWHLGVASPAYIGDPAYKGLSFDAPEFRKGFPLYFKICALSEIRAILATGTPTPGLSLLTILSAYLGVACGYGPEGSALPVGHDPLMPGIEYKLEVEALARMGYIEERDSMVYWTDKIAVAMQSAYLWNADGQPFEEITDTAIAEECVSALAQTPLLTRWYLAWKAKRLTEMDFATFLRDRYDGLYWFKNPDGSKRRDKSILLLKRVYKTLRE